MAQEIKVRPVTSDADLNAFVRLAWKLNERDPLWSAPMLFDVKRRISKKHNHFFSHGEAELFLAWRGTEPVGRITAQMDFNYDEHWGGKTGFLGWYEAVDDLEVARALFGSAGDWLRQQGRDKMQGPFNYNINDECGLLVDGFDTPPMIMNPHNLSYYQNHFDQYGFVKAQDLYCYRMDTTAEAPADVVKFAEMVRGRGDITVRTWNMRNFKQEMKKWLEVYNSAWEKNWGAVKLTEAEFMAHTVELRWLSDPELIFVAEKPDGEVIGMAMTLPNLNEYIKPCNGHIYNMLPTRWYDMVVKKKYQSCRVFTLGVKEAYRRSGVGAVFYYDTLKACKRKGYQWGEMSWILESNDAMNRAIQHMGGEVYKTYRIYEIGL